MDRTRLQRKTISITKVLTFILFAILPLILGIYFMLLPDWFALGLPLAFIGVVMIVTYLSMRRTLRKAVTERPKQEE